MKILIANDILCFLFLKKLKEKYVLLINFLNTLKDLSEKSFNFSSDQSVPTNVSENRAYTQGSSETTPFSKPRSLMISDENWK